MIPLFFKLTLAAYLLSTIGYAVSLVEKRIKAAKVSTFVFLAGFAFHTVFLVSRAVEAGYNPIVTLYDFLMLFAWALSGAYLAFQLKTKTRVLGALISPLALLLMIIASERLDDAVVIPQVLKGGLVSVHVILSVAGEVLFTLACLAGMMYLVQEVMIKNHRVNNFSRLLPPLRDLDKVSSLCLLWGFPFFTLGVIAGSLWARSVWGSHWAWDPKQIWTLIAWFFYALLIHQRLAIGWTGRKSAMLSIAAFSILLAAFISISMYTVSVHSF
jgi:cytochrome c-type biogenesis protein CcsB